MSQQKGMNFREFRQRFQTECQRHFKMSIFAEMECRFLLGSIQVLYSLIHHITCRFEARQALIYQLVLGLTGENGKYNYSRAVHVYPPFFDIPCSAKIDIFWLALTGMTITQLAKRAGVSAGVVRRIIRGAEVHKAETVDKLAGALGVAVYNIIKREG